MKSRFLCVDLSWDGTELWMNHENLISYSCCLYVLLHLQTLDYCSHLHLHPLLAPLSPFTTTVRIDMIFTRNLLPSHIGKYITFNTAS